MVEFNKLSIKNIAAISEAEIDFKCPELVNEEIFLIDGKNGAGKSTILDCICLALYGTTTRLMTNKEDASNDAAKIDGLSAKDSKNLLRRGTTEGRVTLSFIGKNGHHYVADYEIHRANGKIDGNLISSWTLEDEDINTTLNKVGKINQEIASNAIGQEFADFSKTVLIPQGQCAEIVKESADKRGELLGRIVDCRAFVEAGRAIYKKSTTIDGEYDKLLLRIGDIVLLDDTQIAERNQKIADLEAANKADDARKSELNEVNDAYKGVAEASEELNKAGEEESKGKEKYYDLCGGLAYLKQRIEEEKEECSRLAEQIAAEASNAEMYRNAQTIVAGLRAGIDAEAKAVEKDNLADEYKGKQEGLEAKVVADAKAVDDVLELIKANESALAEASERLNALKEDEVNDKKLACNKKLLDVRNFVEKTIPACETSKEASDSAKESVAKLKEQIGSESEKASRASENAAEKKRLYEVALAEYEAKYICAQDIVDNLRSLIAEKESEYCPVCGQKIQDDLQFEVVDKMIANLAARRDETLRQYQAADLEVRGCETSLRSLKSSLENAEGLETKASAAYSDVLKSFASECASIGVNPDSAGILADVESIKQVIADEVKSLDEVLGQIKTVRGEIDSLGKDSSSLAKKKGEADLAASRSKSAADQNIADAAKAKLDAESFRTEAKDKFDAAIAMITIPSWIDAWNVDRSAAIDAVSNGASEYFKKVDRKNTLDKNLGPAGKEIDTIEISKASVEAAFPDWAVVDPEEAGVITHEVYDCQVKWSNLQSSVATLRQIVTDQNGRLAKNKPVVDSYEALDPANSYESLVSELGEIGTRVSERDQKIGSIKTELSVDADTRAKKEGLLREKDAMEIEKRKWNDLCAKFGDANGRKFRDIALCFIFSGIVSKANSILRGIAPRYTLVSIPGTLELRIQDDECGGMLSLNGLSGGETFVASLSMALALATMRAQSSSCDHLFIDEGFGSLDGDYLSLVMNTLHNLHSYTGGKKVGIISHMQAMSDSIPTHIEVDKHRVRITVK